MEVEPTSVVITGAAGNIGKKIRAHLEGMPQYRLTLLDRNAGAAGGIVEADLSRFSCGWTRRFRGADAVIHLAANGEVHDPWARLVTDNVDATINVFEAAAAHGVKRVVFASSVQVVNGYDSLPRITPELPPNPTNYYGVSKSVGERLGRHYAGRHGMSVICLRFGLVQPGANEPPEGRYQQRRWLSNGDLCRALERAVHASVPEFAVVHVVSGIVGAPWEMESAQTLLGYHPQDVLTLRERGALRRWVSRVRQRGRRTKRALRTILD